MRQHWTRNETRALGIGVAVACAVLAGREEALGNHQVKLVLRPPGFRVAQLASERFTKNLWSDRPSAVIEQALLFGLYLQALHHRLVHAEFFSRFAFIA